MPLSSKRQAKVRNVNLASGKAKLVIVCWSAEISSSRDCPPILEIADLIAIVFRGQRVHIHLRLLCSIVLWVLQLWTAKVNNVSKGIWRSGCGSLCGLRCGLRAARSRAFCFSSVTAPLSPFFLLSSFLVLAAIVNVANWSNNTSQTKSAVALVLKVNQPCNWPNWC